MKKGFTLIELIITIALLGLIGTTIATNMTGILDSEQEKEYKKFQKTLTEAACVYVDSNAYLKINGTECSKQDGCLVGVGTILSQGLITEDDLINPKTGLKINTFDSVIIVNYENGVKKCIYDEARIKEE